MGTLESLWDANMDMLSRGDLDLLESSWPIYARLPAEPPAFIGKAALVEHSVVTDFLNNLALLDLKEAWEDLTGANHVDEGVARTEATTALGLSVTQLESAGAVVESATVADEPIAALRLELEASDALQIIAVTQPRPVEDTFHRNWADRAHAELGVPVLHFYSGTSYVGS